MSLTFQIDEVYYFNPGLTQAGDVLGSGGYWNNDIPGYARVKSDDSDFIVLYGGLSPGTTIYFDLTLTDHYGNQWRETDAFILQ